MADVQVVVGDRELQLSVSGDGIRSVAQPPVVMHYRDMSVIGVVLDVGIVVCCTGQHPGWTVFWHGGGDNNPCDAWAPLLAVGSGHVVRVDSPWAVVLARGHNGSQAFAAVDTQNKTLAAADASGRAAWCGPVRDIEAAVVCRDGPESFGLLVCVTSGHPRSILAWPLGRRDLDRLRRASAGVRLPLRYAGDEAVTVPPAGGRPNQGWHDYLTAQGVPLGVVMDVGGGEDSDDDGDSLGEAEAELEA